MNSLTQAARMIGHRVSCMDIAKLNDWQISRYGRMDFCPICGYNSNHKGSGGVVFYPDGNYYCNYSHHGGNTVDFVMELYGMTFPEALQWLNETFSLNVQLSNNATEKELEQVSRMHKMRNAWLVLYELAVKIYAKIAESGIVEPIQESNVLLDDCKAMIEKLS